MQYVLVEAVSEQMGIYRSSVPLRDSYSFQFDGLDEENLQIILNSS